MTLNTILLQIVQITAIGTFLIFMLFILLPKILNKKSKFKRYFFHNKSIIKDSLILISFYTFLFYHLFYLNKNYSPLPIYILGFLSAMTGLLVAHIGRLQLRKLWNPLTNIYSSKKIISSGIFSKIRHPIYFGRLAFFLGVMLMLNLIAIFLAPFYWDYLRNKLIREEKYLQEVNPQYKHYMKRVKRGLF